MTVELPPAGGTLTAMWRRDPERVHEARPWFEGLVKRSAQAGCPVKSVMLTALWDLLARLELAGGALTR